MAALCRGSSLPREVIFAGIFHSERELLQGYVLAVVRFNVFLQVTTDEVTQQPEMTGITGGVSPGRNSSGLHASVSQPGDIPVIWLAYDDAELS